MKTLNNATVSVKKAVIVSDDNMTNINLANNAIKYLTLNVTKGKNAAILKTLASDFAKQKQSTTSQLLVKDKTLKGLLSKVYQCQSATATTKIVANDNYAEYVTILKSVISSKAELSDKRKTAVKNAVKTAQVLRNGVLSKYAHDEISFLELTQVFGFDVKTEDNNTSDKQEQEQQDNQEPIALVDNSFNLEEFFNTVKGLDSDTLAHMQEIIANQLQALNIVQLQKAG